MRSIFARIRRPEAAPPWGLLWPVGTIVMAFVFMAVVGSALATMFTGADLNALVSGGAQVNAVVVGGWAIGGVLTIALVLVGQRGNLAGLRLQGTFPLLIAFGIGLGAVITLDLLAILFTGRVTEPPETARLAGGAAATLWVMVGLFVVVIQPISEEIVFRGMLYPALREAQNVWAAIVVSGVLYGLFHALLYTYPTPDVPFGWWYFLVEPLAIGLILSVLRAATQSTGATVAAHVGVGVFALLKTMLITGLIA